MGKPPIPVIINMSLATIGLGLSLYGLVVRRPGVSLIGAGVAALSFVSSLLFLLVLRHRGQFR